MDTIDKLVNVARNYCGSHGITCKRFSRSQVEIAYTGTRNGYDTVVAYFKNKSSKVCLYIDFDIMRGIDNEVLEVSI